MDAVTGDDVLFREVQKFRQAWLWLIVLLVGGGMWIILIMNMLRPSAPEGYWPVLTGLAFTWLLVGVVMPVFLWLLELRVDVRRDGIHYRFAPLHLRTYRIPFEEIQHFEPRTYRPVVEYGGWGIRYGFHGRAYNVSGNRGVQLTLTNGKRILFGSQRSEELAAAIALGRGEA